METIAVYFEPVAKSYGLQTITGLVMVRTAFAIESFRPSGRPETPPAPADGQFSFVMLQGEPDGAAVMYAVAAAADIPAVLDALGPRTEGNARGRAIDRQPVEMVIFQGPHFYERYGIAAAALEKLREKRADLLLAGFSGSMAYLVVPAGTAESARAALAECLSLP
jgi:hypothetical protein